MRLLATLILAALPMAAQTERPAAAGFRQSIEGTWEISAQQTTPPPLFNFKGLFSFLPGGVLITSDETAFAGLASQNPDLGLIQGAGHGQWARVGARQFLFNLTKLNFTGRGAPSGTTRIRGIITLGDAPDEVTAEFKFDLYLPDGRRFLSGTGSSKATRMEIEVP